MSEDYAARLTPPGDDERNSDGTRIDWHATWVAEHWLREQAEARETALRERVASLERGIVAIRNGTVDGTVGGEDVVWFDEVTTLHDWCECLLSPGVT